MKLLAHHTLHGHGGMGEGMSVQLLAGGRRILWLAHERAPKNFTAVDVTDPRDPRVLVQTDLPHARMRSNSLEVVGDLLAVAYQTERFGAQPAGFELFDVSRPEQPRSVSFFDCSGPSSKGVHQLWFADGAFVHMSSGAPDWTPRSRLDDQIYRIVDVRDPARPREIGRWWLPGTGAHDSEPAPVRPTADTPGSFSVPGPGGPAPYPGLFKVHNTNVYPERPDRAYLGYLDGGAVVLDIADMARPQLVARWDPSPPYPGFTHTLLPLFRRDLWVVSDESIVDGGADWPKLTWILDARVETHPVPIATLPMPPREEFAKRGGRFGSHNLHENPPKPGAWFSDEIVLATFFNAGVRAFDLRDPYQPREIDAFVPPAPAGSPVGAIQMNDVFVDDRGVVFAVDRFCGGLYVLELEPALT